MALPTVETSVEALLDVLDEDIRHIEATLSRLDVLRTLLIKRDDKALEKLLDDIHRHSEAYAANEQRRQALRRDLAAALGCRERDLTLSKLREELSGPDCTALTERQVRLRSLVAQLKREYTLTGALVLDCARFNRSLMQAFFGPGGRSETTYSAGGVAKHKTGATLMSVRL
jgi:hypothetical protein